MHLSRRSIRPSGLVQTARVLLISAVPLLAQGQTEVGIPVTDPLVLAKCGTCHAADEQGNLQRISWERATPEGWQDATQTHDPRERRLLDATRGSGHRQVSQHAAWAGARGIEAGDVLRGAPGSRRSRAAGMPLCSKPVRSATRPPARSHGGAQRTAGSSLPKRTPGDIGSSRTRKPSPIWQRSLRSTLANGPRGVRALMRRNSPDAG